MHTPFPCIPHSHAHPLPMHTPFPQVLEMVRPMAAKLGLETPLELWGFFVKQCRSYLHIVLCMSPIGGAFRERLRQNPSIINCCTIDWWVLRQMLPRVCTVYDMNRRRHSSASIPLP